MAAGPQRRTEPARHLGAHIVPVERALIARAEALEKPADPEDGVQPVGNRREWLAGELRALAGELHHW